MSNEVLAAVDREILAWPGVSKEEMAGGSSPGGFTVPPATVYNLGRRQLGHIHVTGTADINFPRTIAAELVAAGRAVPHPAGFAGVVSYTVRTAADVPQVVALFRLGYDRAQASIARRAAQTSETSPTLS